MLIIYFTLLGLLLCFNYGCHPKEYEFGIIKTHINKMTKPQNNIDRPIQRHLDSRNHREQRIWTLKEGGLYTVLDGREVTAEEFDRINPPFNPVSFLLDPENRDRTNAYLI